MNIVSNQSNQIIGYLQGDGKDLRGVEHDMGQVLGHDKEQVLGEQGHVILLDEGLGLERDKGLEQGHGMEQELGHGMELEQLGGQRQRRGIQGMQ